MAKMNSPGFIARNNEVLRIGGGSGGGVDEAIDEYPYNATDHPSPEYYLRQTNHKIKIASTTINNNSNLNYCELD
jgi:hypothetical protein